MANFCSNYLQSFTSLQLEWSKMADTVILFFFFWTIFCVNRIFYISTTKNKFEPSLPHNPQVLDNSVAVFVGWRRWCRRLRRGYTTSYWWSRWCSWWRRCRAWPRTWLRTWLWAWPWTWPWTRPCIVTWIIITCLALCDLCTCSRGWRLLTVMYKTAA